MNIIFTLDGFEDYIYWQKYDKKILKKLNDIIQETARDPFSGKGKIEKLKYNLQGFYSKRITKEHRLVYSVEEDAITIISCRHHY